MKNKNPLFSKLIHFLSSPREYDQEKISPLKKITNIFIFVSWAYALIIPLGLLISALLTYLNYSGVNSLEELLKTEDILTVILLATLIGPLLEETMFRLALRFNPIYLTISTFLILKTAASQILANLLFGNENLDWLIASGGSLLVYSILKNPKTSLKVQKFYQTRYVYIFYFLTITFGYVHLMNYSDVQTLYPALIFLAIPQVIVGALLGYVRIFYGFRYGVLLHGLYNLVVIIPILLSEDQNKNYQAAGYAAAIAFLLIFLYGVISLVSSIIGFFKTKEKRL